MLLAVVPFKAYRWSEVAIDHAVPPAGYVVAEPLAAQLLASIVPRDALVM